MEEIKLNEVYGKKGPSKRNTSANPVPDNESCGSGANKQSESSRVHGEKRRGFSFLDEEEQKAMSKGIVLNQHTVRVN